MSGGVRGLNWVSLGVGKEFRDPGMEPPACEFCEGVTKPGFRGDTNEGAGGDEGIEDSGQDHR